MFGINYAVRELLGRYRLTLINLAVIGIAFAVIVTTISFGQALRVANEQSLKPLNKLGADMMITLPPPPLEWVTKRSIDFSDDQLLSDKAKVGNDIIVMSIKKSETKTESIYEKEILSLDSETLGPFDDRFLNRLKKNKAVGFVQPVILLGHYYEKQTTPKIISEEEKVAPVKLSEAEEAELEKKAQVDPMVQKYAKELMQLEKSKAEPEYTEADYKRMDKLSFLLGQRKMEVYNKLRPDAFPASVIPKKMVKPPEPKVEIQTAIVGAFKPNKKNGLIRKSDITEGRFFNRDDDPGAVLRQDYAAKKGLKVGGNLKIMDRQLKVIGIAWPGLGQNLPGIFVTSGWLNRTFKLKMSSLLLVKLRDARFMTQVKKFIEQNAKGAIIIDDENISNKISGSVVDTKKLMDSYGFLVDILVVFVSSSILILANVYRISRRRRDIAILLAMGWNRIRIASQIIFETILVGFGGIVLGSIGAIYLSRYLGKSMKALNATIPRWEQFSELKKVLAFIYKMVEV